MNNIKNIEEKLEHVDCKIIMEPEYLNVFTVGYAEIETKLTDAIKNSGSVKSETVKEIAKSIGNQAVEEAVRSAIAKASSSSSITEDITEDTIQLDNSNLQKFLEEVNKNLQKNLAHQLLFGFTNTIKSLFFNPNCKTLGDVSNYIGVTFTKDDIINVFRDDIDSIFTSQYKRQKYINEIQERIGPKKVQKLIDMLKLYKNLIPKSLINIDEIIKEAKYLQKRYDDVVSDIELLFKSLDSNDEIEKILKKQEMLFRTYNNYNEVKQKLELLMEKNFSKESPVYKEIYDKIQNNVVCVFDNIVNTVIPIIALNTNDINDLVKELRKIIDDKNQDDTNNYIYQLVTKEILDMINQAKKLHIAETWNSQNFVDYIIEKKQTIITKVTDSLDINTMKPFISHFSHSYNCKLLETITQNISDYNKTLNELEKKDVSLIEIPYKLYSKLVKLYLTNKGYDFGKFYPPVDYIKQHFPNEPIENVIQKYLSQSTIFLKSVMQTFKYPVNLLTFESLLTYQKITGDNSVLTPERINQLRSQIVQIINFIQSHNIDMSKKVTKQQIKQILSNALQDDKITNALSDNIVEKTTENINNVITFYNEVQKNKPISTTKSILQTRKEQTNKTTEKVKKQ